MRSTMMIRTAKTGYILLSALFCAIGVAMLAGADWSAETIGLITGATLATFGAVKLLGFYSRDLYRLAFQHDFALGILAIALGMQLMFRRSPTISALCLVLGLEIAMDGLFKLQTSMDARRFGLNTWWLMCLLAGIAVSVGILLVICPFEGVRLLARLIGASLLALGLLNLCVALCAIRILPRGQAGNSFS